MAKPTGPRVGPVGGGSGDGGPGARWRRRGLAPGFKRPSRGRGLRDGRQCQRPVGRTRQGRCFENQLQVLGLGPNLQVPADAQTAATAGGLLIVALAQQGRDHQQAQAAPQGRSGRMEQGEGFEQPQATPVVAPLQRLAGW